MSLHRSLKSASALKRHRNVLTRAERIEHLEEEERWQESDGVFGLPKVAHRKSKSGKKSAKAEVGAEGAAGEGEAGGAPAEGAGEKKK